MRPAAAGPRNKRVVAVAYDGLCLFEYGIATELFGLERPELELDWYRFETVSVDPAPLRMTAGVTLAASTDLRRLARAGTIVLPGWRNPAERPQEALLDALRRAHERGARIMSICSGVFVLAATGLLDGKPATTHWRYADRLARAFPRIDVHPDVLYVDNGSLLTSAGSAAGIDLGLHLIRRDYGAHVANQVARRLVVPPHRHGGQAQFIDIKVGREHHDSLADALTWAQANLTRPISVDALAARAHLAPRTLARRFRNEMGTSPHKWLTQQRIALAQRLLETTTASIDQVATDAGFRTAVTLRHHFQQALGISPTGYRQQFRQAA
jgi:AraC family transcriptional regulator, transcriptional activator FtrA